MRLRLCANHQGGFHPPWISLGMAVLALGVYLLAGPAAPALVYHDTGLSNGQWWRALSAHLVHSDTGHLLWDVGALLLLGLLFEHYLYRFSPMLLLGTALIIDAWLYYQMPELNAYCGLSGLLNALLAAGLLLLWRETRSPWPILAATLALVKIAWEWRQGEALFTDTAWAAVPEIHAVGFASGLCFALAAILIGARGRRRALGIEKPTHKPVTYTMAPRHRQSLPASSLPTATVNYRRLRRTPGHASITHAALDRQTTQRV